MNKQTLKLSTLTNAGDRCHQYIQRYENAIIIKKIVLTRNNEYPEDGFVHLRSLRNNMYVFQQIFSIKISSLNEINDKINKL